MAAIPEIQMSLLPKGPGQGPPFRSVVFAAPAGFSFLLLSTLLWSQDTPLWMAAAAARAVLGDL